MSVMLDVTQLLMFGVPTIFSQEENIYFILVAFVVFHVEVSGGFTIFLHPENIQDKSVASLVLRFDALFTVTIEVPPPPAPLNQLAQDFGFTFAKLRSKSTVVTVPVDPEIPPIYSAHGILLSVVFSTSKV